MPWKECDHMSERKEFSLFARTNELSMKELCHRFGISRKTGYKILSRFREQGEAGLADRSRRPHYSPFRTSPEIEKEVLSIRAEHPWGGRKIRKVLMNRGIEDVPAISTITSILRRNGCISNEESMKRKPWIRFERPHPNDLWQMDFKGHFATGAGRCHPLTILDDHSRYLLCLQACSNERAETVQKHLITVFRRYGMPLQMNTDNGPPWGTEQGQYTFLSMWLIKLGVVITYSAPYHPQTNGKDERFHRTLVAEVIQREFFKHLKHAQKSFDWWQPVYNCERPHEGIGDEVPASRYRPSNRPYPEKLPPIEYAPGDNIRRVGLSGIVRFKGRRFNVPKFLHGEYVAIRMTAEDGIVDIFYVRQKLKRVDLRTGKKVD